MSAVMGANGLTETTGERDTTSVAATLERTLNQAIGSVRADAVFGRPVEKGTTTVIPCAEVMVGLGMGGGSGQGPATEKSGTGEGLGGGGGARGRPIAVIVIRQDGVTVQPVPDATRIVLAALTTVGFMTFWLARLAANGRGAKRGAPSLGRLTRSLRS